MLSVLKTPPSNDVLSLEEAKKYLRVDETADDSEILAMIKSATRKVESIIDKKLCLQTWQIYFDQFAMSSRNQWWDGSREMAISELVSPSRWIDLPFGPMKELVEFATFDNESPDPIVSDLTNYIADTVGIYGRVALKLGAVWPTTILRPINGIRITGTFGYGSTDDVPDDIKQAVKIWVASLYEHRGDESDIKPPTMALSLLEPFRTPKVPRG